MSRWTVGISSSLLAAALGATALIASAGGVGGRSAALTDRALFATLTGAAEVGNDGQRNAGDRDGKGAASLLITGNRVCYGIQVNGIGRPIAAHVHRARAGANGPIVVPLTAPRAGNNGFTAGCANASSAVRNAIKGSPTGFYVNVHTAAFPSGALRGQLRP